MPMTKALDEWRTAERAWAAMEGGDEDDRQAAALRVIEAWMRYQELAGMFDGHAVLVADRSGRFVCANHDASRLFGLPATALIGRTVADITAPGSAGLQEGMWRDFLEAGAMKGTYSVVGPGGVVEVHYDARAHHPLPGYFMSKLRSLG